MAEAGRRLRRVRRRSREARWRIDLYRDGYGVGHAFADTPADAFFAQGWIHAEDRMWQMERDRRRARGRWAEVAGASAIAFDLLARRLDLERAAAADLRVLVPATLEMLDAYAAGVNSYLSSARSDRSLPEEFDRHEVDPAPWLPSDSLLIHRVRHVLMGSARYKLWRAVVAEVAGDDVLRTIARESDEDLSIVDGGSNNWVVAGSRTRSGAPLLAGDPHRELERPNVYTQSHVACAAFDAIGIGFAGVPGFGHFGHTRRVAWSITHAMLDDQDLFVERFDGEGRYECDAERLEPVRRQEQVLVAGSNAIDIDVVETRHGPVITGDTVHGEALSLRWTATCEPNTGFDCFVPMLAAESVPQLFDAMRAWVEPGNNLVAADVDGSIGYLLRGRVPIRPIANGDAPVPGWTSGNDWQGWLAFDEWLRAIDPPRGRVVTANNRPASTLYPHYIGRDFAAPNRARRITDRLVALGAATVDDMVGVLGDTVSLPGRAIAARLQEEPAPAGPAAVVHQAITGWDGDVDTSSVGALAYEVFRRELMFVLLDRSGLAAAADHPYLKLLPGIEPLAAVWRLVPRLLLAGDRALLGGWTWSRAIAEALDRAADWIGANVGDDPATWRWGAVHKALLGVEVPGDADTVRVGAFVATSSFDCRHASVARYVFDLEDWDASRWVIPLGVSGRAGGHATDQHLAWATGALTPMLYSRAAVEADARDQSSRR